MRRTGITFGLALVLLMAFMSAVALADEESRWGKVDTQRLESQYKGMQDAYRQFQELVQSQQQQLQEKYNTRLLSDDEQQEFLDLANVGAPTDERDKRLSELQELSSEREQTLQALQKKKDERTPEEEEEYQKLNTLYQRRMNELNLLQTELQQSQQAKSEELLAKIRESVDAAVKLVAEEKNLTMVFHTEMVLYGGLDITDEVLAKLNGEQAD